MTGEEIDWGLYEAGVFDKFFFIRSLISCKRIDQVELGNAQERKIEENLKVAFEQLVRGGRLTRLNEVSRNIHKRVNNLSNVSSG